MSGKGPMRAIGFVIVGTIYAVLRLYLQVPFDVMLAGVAAIVFAGIIGYPLGHLVGYLISRDTNVDTAPYRVVAGANLIAWLFPVAGMVLSGIAFQFARKSDTTRAFYWVLAAIGGWAAIANAGIGGANEMRIRERCTNAAPEAWTKADFEKYCRG